MPTSYPGAIDALTNPNASDMLDSPPHATQHSDANDALEAIETKLGTGASVPTTVGHVLKVTGAGATAYAAPAPTLTVKESDGAPSVSDVDTMSFANATITDQGSGDVLITIPASLTVQEVDGSPAVTAVDKIIFPNGSVTDNGSGDVTVRDVPVGFIGAAGNGAVTVVATATNTKLDLAASANMDTDLFWNGTTDRITIPAGLSGWYAVTCRVSFAASAVGDRRIAYVYKNGVSMAKQDMHSPKTNADITVAHVEYLAAGDYLEVFSYQDTGGNLNVNVGWIAVAKLDSGKVGQGVGARARATAAQAIVTATQTAITFNAEDFDTDGFHSTSTNTSRITIPAGLGGKYLLIASGGFASNATGLRTWRFRKNGVDFLAPHAATAGVAGSSISIPISAVADFIAGDYIEFVVYQDSGADLSFGSAAIDSQANIQIMRLNSGSANYTGPLWGSGTAFPTGPTTNQRFTRTDRGIDYYWDGTRWLSTTLYSANYQFGDMGVTSRFVHPTESFDVWLLDYIVTFFVDTADATNRWEVKLTSIDAGVETTLSTVTYNSAVNFTRTTTAIGAVLAATVEAINILVTKVGAPTNGAGGAKLTYRLIG